MRQHSKLSRLLSLALCLCMVLAMLPALPLVANAASFSGGTQFLLKPNSNWTSSKAWFAAYFFNNSTGKNAWVKMSAAGDNGIYVCDAPSGTWANVIFCRMNSASSTLNWNNVWDQTNDLTFDGSKDLYTIASGAWSNGAGTWSKATCADAIHRMVNGKCSRCGTGERTVYFQNNWEWQDVKVYYWKGKVNNGWPGKAVEYFGEAQVGDATRYYSKMTIPEDIDGFIINGTNNSNTGTNKQDQTATITLDDWYDGITYYLDAFTTETDGHHVCQVKDYVICKDFAKEHKYVDDVCTRCEETYCQVNGHKFGSGLGKNDTCERCGTGSMTIFFKSSWGWTDVHFYEWYEGTDINNKWPGDKMNLYTSSQVGNSSVSYYYIKVPTDIDDVIVNGIKNDGTGVRDQSPSIPGSELYHGACIEMSWDEVNNKNAYKIFDINDVYQCVLGHTYGETQYVWSDDYVQCTAVRTCTRNANHIETELREAASYLVQEGTCQVPFIEGREVRFDSSWATTQRTNVEFELDPNNHVYGCYYVVNADYTHTAKCLECDAEMSTNAHIDEVKDGYCDLCGAIASAVYAKQVVADLKGKIGLHYYLILSDEVLADPDAYIHFYTENGLYDVQIPVGEGEDQGNNIYVFTIDVAVREMTEVIYMQVYSNGPVFAEARPYSVRTYAENVLKQYDDVKTKNLMEAMVNFGAAAQAHFGYNAEDPANSILDTAPDYSNVTIEGFASPSNQGTENVKLYASSLLLESETTLRLFFKGLPAYVTYNGEYLRISQRSGLYYVEIPGIHARDLDEYVTVVVHDGTTEFEVTYNPMTYCQAVQNSAEGTYSQEMQNLVRALYLYNKAANAYFEGD